MIRLLDLLFSTFGLLFALPVFLIISILGAWDTGSPFFCQKRLGRGKQPFILIKFRTMKVGTESVATHLVSSQAVTPLGRFLRKTKLDELPQLWNVFTGDMSLVGPRPNLPGQQELIAERDACDVYAVRPGITGAAQVMGVDMSTPRLLAEVDKKMIESFSVFSYFKYIVLTVCGRGQGDRVVKKP